MNIKRRIRQLKNILIKSANRSELDSVYEEHMKMDKPLSSLHTLYLASQEQEREDLFQLFKDKARADEFYESHLGGIAMSDEEEAALFEEFGAEAVDRYIYGIGTENLVGDDYQEILLKLLDTHPKLKRRRDKRRIKERFDIYHY